MPALASFAVAVGFLYAWLVTAGNPADPPESTKYYDMLADAFAAGQLHLRLAPDPRLVQSPNPYDPAQLPRIPECKPGLVESCHLWDASYYQGRYYLYWGPAPAVALAILKTTLGLSVEDNVIAMMAAVSLFALTTGCILTLWRRFFGAHPQWLLAPGVVMAAMAYPLPWVLDAPRIYEAAILLGASLLMAGLLEAIPVLAGESTSPGRIATSSALWGLAFATRAVLALPIAVLCAAVAWRQLRPQRAVPAAHRLVRLALLAIPVGAVAGVIGLYNMARFADPLEFGWRFAIGPPQVQAGGAAQAFSPARIPVNLYYYLLSPVELVNETPFVKPVVAGWSVGPWDVPRPAEFYGEYVSGLVFAAPFFLFSSLLVRWLVCAGADCSETSGPGGPPAGLAHPEVLRFVAVALTLAALAAFLPILTVYAVTARYLLDVSPLLTLIASLGAWTAYDSLRSRIGRIAAGAVIASAAVVSAVVSYLLALTGNW
jgi:hypothetical protein